MSKPDPLLRAELINKLLEALDPDALGLSKIPTPELVEFLHKTKVVTRAKGQQYPFLATVIAKLECELASRMSLTPQPQPNSNMPSDV